MASAPDPVRPDVDFAERRAERLVLRRFRAGDAPSLSAYRSEPAVARYQSWDIPYTPAQARSFIDALSEADPDTPGEWFQFAVIEAATGLHIGDVAAEVHAQDPRLARIGVTLASAAQGQGYATEAVTWLLDYLLVERRKHRVTAECDARNTSVVTLLQRLGMRQEAHHVQAAWWKGEWTDECVYAVLASEWAARRASV